MKADLHCHSLASDGALTPAEVVARAHANGVQMLALTDHDTLRGLSQAESEAASLNLELVSGIELSSQWSGVGIHIVGLAVDTKNAQLLHAVGKQEVARETRAREIGRRLGKKGFEAAYEGAKRIAGESQIGRPHFARFLVEQGYVLDQETAFNKYLGAGKIGDVKSQWPSINEIVSWIHTAGGYAVLAHPDKYKLTRMKLRRLLTDFKAAGGDALEVVSGQQNRDITSYYTRLCEEFEFYASCGSDFHHPSNAWCDLGKFQDLPKTCKPVWELWSDRG